MRYTDNIHQATWLGINIRNPFLIFNNFYLNTNHWIYMDFDGDFLSSNYNVNSGAQFKNMWRIKLDANKTGQLTERRLLRGGPKMLMPGFQNFQISISTDPSKKLGFESGTTFRKSDANSANAYEQWVGLTYRPTNTLWLYFTPGYVNQRNVMQYIGEKRVNNSPVYLLGEINQKTVSLSFRVDLAINPELTVQYYAQPYISAGKYSNIKKLTDYPKADKFADRIHIFSGNEIAYDAGNNNYNIDSNGDGNYDFSIANPDFNFKQVRSNFVVRWEYRPGSTLYLVWSQGRTGSAATGDFSYRNDLSDLYKLTPHNVFLVKLSYWFAL
jgi:hypothetical protein